MSPTPENRRRRRDWALWAFVAVMVVQTVVNFAVANTGADLIDQLEERVDTDQVAACERGNEARQADNALVAALAAVAAVADANRAGIDTIARTAVSVPEGVILRPDQQERLDTILAAIDASNATANALLDVAAEKMTAATRDLRDCDRILDDPDATIPAPTTLPIVPPEEG